MPMFSGDVMYEQDGLRITRTERVLVMSTQVPHACLSFAPRGGGEQTTTHVANHHVASHELSLEVDALALLEARQRELVGADGVAMMTACALQRAVVATAEEPLEDAALPSPPVRCVAVATVGLSNLLRAGDSPGALAPVGTINVLLWVSRALSPTARLEALSVATEARTLAVVERALPSRRSGLPASGTGTDCIALLCPIAGADRASVMDSVDDASGVPYAGKHTAVGAVVGRAVYDAVSAGAASWDERYGDTLRRAMREHVRGAS